MKRILSGMRPSGRLHLGNYWGALERWVRLQDSGEYECFYMVADWHALTTGYDDTKEFRQNAEDMVLDWLSAGLDPQKSVLFQQSSVMEHAELSLLFSMITPLGWLERIPTYKEQLRELSEREITTHGFLGYPVLQAADILIYKAEAVPVGEDQLSHVEFTQDVAKRFNHLYGDVFPEPKPLLSATPKVPGLDSRKMSKSYGNTIEISESVESISKKISRMFTDPQKKRADDKGHPDGCVVYAFHKIYNKEAAVREQECREGRIGCVSCKKNLSELLLAAMAPMQKRRAELMKDKGCVRAVLDEGNRKARDVARQTMAEVRRNMGLA
ncbi:MAG TPA: tryptophan--tRNA ligase [Elusimicrobiota bacterium]|nr:tryptophan--tRNA ligase [Elusimicrobiota bacterium]